jgi:hypothetical protein
MRAPLWRRLFMCWRGACLCAPMEDDTHLWGECTTCGQQAGKVSREFLRRYADAEIARREFDAARGH